MSLSGGLVDISPLLTLTLLTSLSLLPLLTLRLTERRPNIRNITRLLYVILIFPHTAGSLVITPACQELEEVSHVSLPGRVRAAAVFTRWWWGDWGGHYWSEKLSRIIFLSSSVFSSG